MALEYIAGIVKEKYVWTEGLFTLKIAVDGVQEFEPGQFLQLAVEVDGERVNRPYSVASPHGAILEFYIVLVEDGELTPHLWRTEAGDRVDVANRAAGSFTLKKTPAAETLWLIGTGTGLAPYIAMLRTEAPWQNYERVVVVHGARHCSDLSYADEFAEMASQRPGKLTYVPTASRDERDGVLSGRITTLLESGQLESQAGLEMSADSSAVMLCGNPAMLDDVESLLEQRGMKKHRSRAPGQIVVERYW